MLFFVLQLLFEVVVETPQIPMQSESDTVISVCISAEKSYCLKC